MIVADYLNAEVPPELFTIGDELFGRLEQSSLPLVEYREPRWIHCDPEPRMPDDLYLPLTPLQWSLTLSALARDGGPANPLLPALTMGRLGVFDPSWYVPNLSTVAQLKFYMVAATRAIIRHTEGGGTARRHDAIQTFYDLHGVPQEASARVPLRFKQVQGGELSATCLWEPHYLAGAMLSSGARVKGRVRARNPGFSSGRIQETVRQEITRQVGRSGLPPSRLNELLIIAWKESKFLQFEVRGKREGLPRQGSSLNDWGIFQLNTLPFADSAAEGYRPMVRKGREQGWPPTRVQVWDWRANIDCGIRLYKVKIREATAGLATLYAKAQAADPQGVRAFNARQRRLECLQRYNGGRYWSGWDASAKRWIPVPPQRRAYADELLRYVEGLEARPRALPPDWNFA